MGSEPQILSHCARVHVDDDKDINHRSPHYYSGSGRIVKTINNNKNSLLHQRNISDQKFASLLCANSKNLKKVLQY